MHASNTHCKPLKYDVEVGNGVGGMPRSDILTPTDTGGGVSQKSTEPQRKLNLYVVIKAVKS